MAINDKCYGLFKTYAFKAFIVNIKGAKDFCFRIKKDRHYNKTEVFECFLN